MIRSVLANTLALGLTLGLTLGLCLPLSAKAQQYTQFKNFSEVRVTGAVSKADSVNNFALIIYNSNYVNLPAEQSLPVTENDAKAMEKLLLGMGYPQDNIRVLANLSKDELKTEVTRFSGKLNAQSSVVVYYSGHGASFENSQRNHIVPADINPDVGEGDYQTRQLLMEDRVADLETDVLNRIKIRNPQGMVVFYDACRNSPIAITDPDKKSAVKPQSFVPAVIQGTAMFYSASDGQTALASLGPQDDVELSVFTRVLVSELSRVPTMRLRDLNARLNSRVSELAQNRLGGPHEQYPEYHGRLRYTVGSEGFCLASIRDGDKTICTGPDPQPIRVAAGGGKSDAGQDTCVSDAYQEQLWELFKDSNDVETLRNILSNNPNSCFAPLAQAKIDQLESRKKHADDELFWSRVKDTDDVRLLKLYLESFEDPLYKREAAALITFLSSGQTVKACEEQWSRIKDSKDPGTVEQFINDNPDCEQTEAANTRLSELLEIARLKGRVEIHWDQIKNTEKTGLLRDFIALYKDGPLGDSPLIKKAEERLALLQIVDEGPTKEEQALWDRAKRAAQSDGDMEMIDLYLAIYRDGHFVDEANALKKEFEARNNKTAEAEARWQEIRYTRNKSVLRGFIRDYPNSERVSDAAARLTELEKEEDRKRAEEERKRKALEDEEREWSSVRYTKYVATVERFLRKYPSGKYASQARSLLNRLKKQEAEDKAWRAAQSRNTESAYRDFMRRYSSSKYISQARQKIEDLRCPTLSSSLSRYDRAKTLVGYYYQALDKQEYQCAIDRWWSVSDKQRSSIYNMGGASSYNRNVVYAQGNETHVVTDTRVRTKTGDWESWRVRVIIEEYQGKMRIVKIKLEK